MFTLIVLTFLIQFATLTYMYIADRKLKWGTANGYGKVKTLTLTKYKYLYVYYERKTGLITKYVFLCMIAYYLVNIVGALLLFILFIIASEILLTTTCVILSLNGGLLVVAASPSGGAFRQHIMRHK